MKTCLILAADPREAGNGHAVRMGALAAEMQSRGWKIDGGAESDVVICDGVDLFHVAPAAKRVAVVDEPRPFEDRPDIIVSGSAGMSRKMFPDDEAKLILVGPQYSLLRPEFRDEDESANLTKSLLGSRSACDIRAVSGVAAADLAYLMRSVPVLITWGGMRSMEAACCGTPAAVIPRNNGEWLNAKGLADAGACVVCHTEEDAIAAARDLLLRPHEWDAISACGRQLVDGLGCKRVADAIESMVN